MAKRALIGMLVLCFTISIPLCFGIPAHALAQSHAKIEEEKELANQVKKRYEVYERLGLAEQEALESGNDADAQLYRKAREKTFVDYKELVAKHEQLKASIEQDRRKASENKE